MRHFRFTLPILVFSAAIPLAFAQNAGERPAAMFRRDWSNRPAQEAWEDLVLRQWWTRWEGTTGPDGTATLRAFYGKHRVSAEAGGKRAEATVELSPGKAGVAVLILK